MLHWLQKMMPSVDLKAYCILLVFVNKKIITNFPRETEIAHILGLCSIEIINSFLILSIVISSLFLFFFI